MSKTGRAPRKPVNLGAAGAKLWEKITAGYELRPDQYSILEDACRETDIIARLEADLEDAPLMVKGSMGQAVPNPSLTEIRQHRNSKRALLKDLQLEVKGASGSRDSVVSMQARKAARARWDRAALKAV